MRQKSLLGQLESEGLQETVLIQSALQTMWALFGFQTWGLLASPAGSSQDLFAFQDDGPFRRWPFPKQGTRSFLTAQMVPYGS